MSTATPETAPALAAYLELLEALASLGIEAVVIGGCAVGAYARLVGETVLSNELDLLVTRRGVELILQESDTLDIQVGSFASARQVPVTVVRWKGREVNLLTATAGLAAPDVEARAAREFRLPEAVNVPVLIVDPFDLLRNKLAVNRPKDAPHIQVLRRFIEAEVIYGFEHEQEPRARIGAAERLLEVLDSDVLDEGLSLRLLPLAHSAADFRFLAHRLPTAQLVEQLKARAPDSELRAAVERIAVKRHLT